MTRSLFLRPGSNDSSPPPDLTHLLRRWQSGDEEAAEELLPLVLAPLRRIAAARLAGERPGHTLQPTALVNEAYLRLVRQSSPWQTRSQFFAVAARSIRRILVDHARRKSAERRDIAVTLPLDEGLVATSPRSNSLLALDEALSRLAALDPLKAQVVECRFFAGLTGEEIAAALGISPATVQRHWQMARAWLHQELAGERATEPRA